MKWPASSTALLDLILKPGPERRPEKGETMEDFNRYAGKRELALQLIHIRDNAKRAAAVTPKARPRVRS